MVAISYFQAFVGRPFCWLLGCMALIVSSAAAANHAGVITVCPSGCDHTTIQAAVNAATDGDTVQLLNPSPHTEVGITVNKDLLFEGMGEAATVVQAAANPGVATDRVFLIAGRAVTFKKMTIRHGVATQGGAIYNDGGTVTLDRATLRENDAVSGGGLFNTTTGLVTLQQAGVVQNRAELGAGVYNAGTLTGERADFFDNVNANRGGGLFNSGTATLHDSAFIANVANPLSAFNREGGGIYSTGVLHVYKTGFVDNVTGGGFTGTGGALYSSGELILSGSEISDNFSRAGSGMAILGGVAEIRRSTITQNGNFGNNAGGGIGVGSGASVIIDESTISNNRSGLGAGLFVALANVKVTNSTIYGNDASITGGGLSACGPTALINVTVSGNEADEDGGGIVVCADGEVSLANVTITNNRADADADNTGNGGGLALLSNSSSTGIAHVRNAILAGNVDLSPGFLNVKAPDCFGEQDSQGHNVIGALGFGPSGTPCTLSGNTTGNIVGQPAALDPLADNGGPTMTHALLSGSPALNAGNPGGCLDFEDILLSADQRHALRKDRCDAGAFESGALIERQLLPAILRP